MLQHLALHSELNPSLACSRGPSGGHPCRLFQQVSTTFQDLGSIRSRVSGVRVSSPQISPTRLLGLSPATSRVKAQEPRDFLTRRGADALPTLHEKFTVFTQPAEER